MLYLVPTPIGNLKDITLRAIETLQSVDLVLAEDTRVTANLLRHFNISARTRSFHAHNEHRETPKIITELKDGKIIALVSDAGMPAISDPGFLLVRACREAGIQVVPLPGPTALVAGLAGSGLPSDRFHFEGFLPSKKGRNKRLLFLSDYPHSIVLYESPFRLVKTLKDIASIFNNTRRVCIAKEISKIHETFIEGTPEKLAKELEQNGKIKGEFVIIIEPAEKGS